MLNLWLKKKENMAEMMNKMIAVTRTRDKKNHLFNTAYVF